MSDTAKDPVNAAKPGDVPRHDDKLSLLHNEKPPQATSERHDVRDSAGEVTPGDAPRHDERARQ